MPENTTFPATLLTIGARDERVPPWATVKWAVAIRSHLGKDCPVHLNLVPGGHFLTDEEEVQLEALEACWLERLVEES